MGSSECDTNAYLHEWNTNEWVGFNVPVVLFAVLPKAGGICSQGSFNIFVKYGSTPDSQLKITLGERELNDEILQQYTHHWNDTHLTIDVPFMSQDVVFEVFLRCLKPRQH